ncbi:hypothetical protein AGMMS50268_41740 [Spirochaetia bacterium]|nr:hypothetical protein AGMMS50268_41740 [Spirochaetia bacterium]
MVASLVPVWCVALTPNGVKRLVMQKGTKFDQYADQGAGAAE